MKFTIASFLLLPAILLFMNFENIGEDPTLPELWSQVDSLQQKGQPRAALKITDQIISLAQKQNSSPDFIKAVQYKAGFLAELEEDGFLESIEYLESQLKNSTNVEVEALIHITLAEQINAYLQRNFHRLQNRTSIVDSGSEKASWGLKEFEDESDKHYKLAARKSVELKNVDLLKYEMILDTGQNSIHLLPSLYEYITHRTIEHFTQGNKYSIKPVEKNNPDWKDYLVPLDEFLKMGIDSANENDDFYILQLFAELEKYQENRLSADALLYTELLRIKFIHGEIVDKASVEKPYLKCLNYLRLTYKEEAEIAMVDHTLALHYMSLANSNNDKEKAGELRVKAHNILKAAVASSESSYGTSKCKQTLAGLEKPTLRFQLEKAVPINKAMLVMLNYKELDEAQIRIAKLTPATYRKYLFDYRFRQNYKQIFSEAEQVAQRNLTLINKNNYTEYSAEFILDGLPAGTYMIYALNDAADISTYAVFHSTNLSFAQQQNANENAQLLVVDRVSGSPLSNVRVNLYDQRGRANSDRQNVSIEGITDEKGEYTLRNATSRAYQIELVQGDDHFITGEVMYTGRFNEPKPRTQATILTDRAIYRPGQEVYFKAIVFRKDPKGIPELLENQKIKIELVNPNGKVAEAHDLSTNGFGSVSGQFNAPETGLNGSYYLRISSLGQVVIRIEDYKRPKFNVEITLPDGELVAGKEVVVSGLAQAFAGTDIQNAAVSYEVTRSREYRHFWWYDYRPPQDDGEQVVATGLTSTNEKGEFEVAFKTLVDDINSFGWRPLYVYVVKADVTDINGETRSGQVTLRIGEPYYISTSIPEKFQSADLSSFTLSSKNAMGKPAEAEVAIEVVSLNPVSTPKISRLWSTPDYPVEDKSEFAQKLNQYSHDKKADYSSWEPGDLVILKSFRFEGDKELDFGGELDPGIYRVTVRSSDGEEKFKQYFTVYSISDRKLSGYKPLNYVLDKDTYEPGEQAGLLLSSPFDASRVLVLVDKQGEIISEEWVELQDDRLYQIPVNEKDRGGFVVHLFYTHQNRSTIERIQVNVPWSNKKLKVTWESFRDKLLPGQEETWKLNIKDPENNGALAEVVAGMYDLSLDEFSPHSWGFDIFPTYYSPNRLRIGGAGLSHAIFTGHRNDGGYDQIYRELPYMKYLPGNVGYGYQMDGVHVMKRNSIPEMAMELSDQVVEEVAEDASGALRTAEPPAPPQADGRAEDMDFSPRENLNETVFFKPQLRTDKNGDLSIEFTMNEALTAWKLQLLAHTKSLQSVLDSREVVTQKEIMIFPQIPRFVREGDSVVVSAKVNRVVDTGLAGHATIELVEVLSGKDVTNQIVKRVKVPFSLETREQDEISWSLNIPDGYVNPIQVIVKAKAGNHTDGELNVLPVLTNRMLITESLPLSVRAGETKTYDLDVMANMDAEGVKPHRLTMEYMDNPVWFAVQSLPYLTDFPHACTEQVAHKIYANAIAGHIIAQFPKIRDVFRQWESRDELISNLNKNQELKSALIEETPWIRDAESEEQQMKNIGLLFDYSRMSDQLAKNMEILFSRQQPSGGFVWFTHGRENIYITQLVIEIYGHLKALGIDLPESERWDVVIDRAMDFTLAKMQERYERLDKNVRKQLHADPLSVQAIYVSSYFKGKLSSKKNKAWDYYYKAADQKWLERSLYEQALLATSFNRLENLTRSEEIIASFRDRAIRSEELGMYWKYDNSYRWFNRPIETHAHIMEAISLSDSTGDEINEMRIWLLKHKQTNRWNTTIATAKAIYALLLRGDDWLTSTKPNQVVLGNTPIAGPSVSADDADARPGTGYWKKQWTAEAMPDNVSQLTITNDNKVISWGAVYWQYFQTIDQVKKFGDNPLRVERSLYRKIKTDEGQKLVKINAGDVKVGDRVTVRLEISVDRMMEFIHLKDVRAAGLEPIDVLSGYHWDGGLGYYQSTTDLGTHFFIDRIQSGSYVLEYDAFASNAGTFSAGLATLQCMYAPEFASHSEGSRLQINR